jgi:hypothetical protein
LGVFTIFIISAALTWCMQKIPAVRILVQWWKQFKNTKPIFCFYFYSF